MFAAIVGWVAALATGRLPAALHRFFCSYIRYTAHLAAYLALVADPYPGFRGEAGSYPVDVRAAGARAAGEMAHPRSADAGAARAARLGRVRRLSFGHVDGPAAESAGSTEAGASGLADRRGVPRLVREPSHAAGCRAGSATRAPTRSATGRRCSPTCCSSPTRYPNADPTAMLAALERPPRHPVRIVGDADDLRRSRVTVLFRLPLAIPHLVWLMLWTIARAPGSDRPVVRDARPGRPIGGAAPLPRAATFATRSTSNAFLLLAANPFPGFAGDPGRLPARPRAPAARPPEPLEDRASGSSSRSPRS